MAKKKGGVKGGMTQSHEGVEIDLSKYTIEEIAEIRNRSDNRISKAIIWLLNSESFFGNILVSLKRNQTIQMPTLGIWYRDGFNLSYNPFFVEVMDNKQLVAVLKHELFHIIFNHIYRKEQREHEVWNYSADFAINSIVEGLPSSGLFPDKEPWKLRKGETAEWYYDTIIQDQELQKQIQVNEGVFGDNNGSGDGNKGQGGGGHESPDEVEKKDSDEDWQNAGTISVGGPGNHDWNKSGLDKEIIESETKRLMKEAYETVSPEQKNQSKCWGNTPGNVIKEIEDFIYQESKIPWAQLMRRFIMFTKDVKRKANRLRPNRRFGWQIPGSKVEEKIHMAIIFDTSGSVSDQEFLEFTNELEPISNVVDKIDVLHCDTTPHHIGEFKKGMPPPARRGYGGTEFSEAIRMAETLKPDGIIYLSDLECHFNFDPTRLPMLWVSTTDIEAPPTHGITIKLEIDELKRDMGW